MAASSCISSGQGYSLTSFSASSRFPADKHRAYSRAVFGKGAVQAAKFLAGKPAGRYDMSDVIGQADE